MHTRQAASTPLHLHPAVWRASQRATSAGRHLSSGYPSLDAELPGGGWPLGQLIELLLPAPGAGELNLLGPALAHTDERPIVLLHPPHPPLIAAWARAVGHASRLLWMRAGSPADLYWCAEQVLRSDAFAALLMWLPAPRFSVSRRLHLAAQAGQTLCIQLRPATAASQPSPAPLRVSLHPDPAGPQLHLLKRRGPPCLHPIALLNPPPLPDATLDRPAPAHARPGHALPHLAH